MKQIIIRSDERRVYLECNQCHVEFTKRPSEVANGVGVFCGKDCYDLSGVRGGGKRRQHLHGHTKDEIAFYDTYGWFTTSKSALEQFIKDRREKEQMVTIWI